MSEPGVDDYDDFDEGSVCPKCDGAGTVSCYCCGDLCICENYGEKACDFCFGAGVTSQMSAGKYLHECEVHAAFFPAKKDPAHENL